MSNTDSPDPIERAFSVPVSHRLVWMPLDPSGEPARTGGASLAPADDASLRKAGYVSRDHLYDRLADLLGHVGLGRGEARLAALVDFVETVTQYDYLPSDPDEIADLARWVNAVADITSEESR